MKRKFSFIKMAKVFEYEYEFNKWIFELDATTWVNGKKKKKQCLF